MKNIILIALLAMMGIVNLQADETIDTCKAYIKEAKHFQSNMKKDKVSRATLAFYKDNVVAYCGNIASKMPFEKKFFANVLMKKDTTTVSNCKLAIKMAKAYDENGDNLSFIAHAHKINISDNCGTLVAKKPSAFCLFDVVDNAKDEMKNRCLASISKAHAAMGTTRVNAYKKEVITNCSKL